MNKVIPAEEKLEISFKKNVFRFIQTKIKCIDGHDVNKLIMLFAFKQRPVTHKSNHM